MSNPAAICYKTYNLPLNPFRRELKTFYFRRAYLQDQAHAWQSLTIRMCSHQISKPNWTHTQLVTDSLPVNQRPRQQQNWLWMEERDDDQTTAASADYWEHRTTTFRTSVLSHQQYHCQSIDQSTMSLCITERGIGRHQTAPMMMPPGKSRENTPFSY